MHDANLHWFADAESPVIDGIGHGLLEGHHRENSLPWWIRPGHGADADRVRQVTGRRSGLGIPIARGSLLSCPVDRDHHRHTVHAPGGQLPRDSYPGRHIVPFERPFLLFCSGYGGLRQFYDGGYLCPGRCRGKLFAIRNGLPAPVVRILGGEVFGVNTLPHHGRRND